MSTKKRIILNIEELKNFKDSYNVTLDELNVKEELVEMFAKHSINTLENLCYCDKAILDNKKLISLDRALKRFLTCLKNNYSSEQIFNNINLISYVRNDMRYINKEYDVNSYNFIISKINKNNSLLKKQNKPKTNKYNLILTAHGQETAKKFSKDDFLKIYNEKEAKNIESSKYSVYLKKENIIVKCASFNERVLISNLQYHGSFELLRTQFPKIPNGNRGYHPDVFLLTNDGNIVVIEVKPQFDMNSINSQNQYCLLKEYCKNKGYLYLMCDKWLKDYESLSNIRVSAKVKNRIEKAIKKRGYFNYDDYIKLMPKDKKDRNAKRKIDNQIARYVSQRNLKQTGRWSKKMKIKY